MRKLAGLTVVMALVCGAANAQLSTTAVPVKKKAPAPLLAAGIPAFLALGGGAFIGRIKRRRINQSVDGADGEPASFDVGHGGKDQA